MDLSNIKFPSCSTSDYFGLSVGADPEVFLQTGPKTILEPTAERITQFNRDKRITPDGAQLEFHPVACSCRGSVIDSIRECFLRTDKVATAHDASIAITPAIRLSPKCLSTFTPAAQQFGCDPDWSAYTLNPNQNAMDASRHPFRYGGGHIHVGTLQKNFIPAYALMADLCAGLLATAMTLDAKATKTRRKRFGQAGCFRQQPHGWEYRTLDNFWLLHPKLTYLFIGLVRDATVLVLKSPNQAKELIADHGDIARDIINEVDITAAKTLWQELSPQLEALLPIKECQSINATPNGISELFMASKLLPFYEERVKPELSSKSLDQLWRFDVTDQTGYQQANCYISHGGFSRGGFEEFVNPILSKMYDWCESNPTRNYLDYKVEHKNG